MKATARPVVLLVEDNPYTRRALRRLLHQTGFGLVEAADGREAIDAVQATYCDVAIVDFLLPDMNGRAVADALLRHRPKLPVICLTGAVDDAHMTCPPFAAILQKPVDMMHLENTLRDVLRKAGAP